MCPGIMRVPTDKESLIPSVSREEIEQLREDEIITGGMIPRSRARFTQSARV
jgi:acetylglutamate kinase